MITLNSSPTPPEKISGQAMIDALSLLAMLADPAQTKELLRQMWEAKTALAEQKVEAETAVGELKTAKAAHDAAISAERSEHDAALKSEREKFESERAAGLSEVRAKRAEADRLRAQAKTDAEAAATLKSDLEDRLSRLRSIAG